LDIGYGILDIGHWMLDIGCWTLDAGHWMLACYPATLQYAPPCPHTAVAIVANTFHLHPQTGTIKQQEAGTMCR
jgi:hypothetical protein